MPKKAAAPHLCPPVASTRWLATGIVSLLIAGNSPAENALPRFKSSSPTLRSFFSGHDQEKSTVQSSPPKAPAGFNPDPGGGSGSVPGVLPSAPDLLFPDELALLPQYGSEPLPEELKLPRRGVRGRGPINKIWHYPEYPLGREGLGVLPNTKAVPNRWFLNFPHWTRYRDPTHETAYQYETPSLWHPYRQSTLKGDVPIIGEDIFLNITAKNFSLIEFRNLPVGSGVSTARGNSPEFFGRGDQAFFSNDTSLALDLFEGETAFKPVHWLIRVLGVYNTNLIRVRENNLVDPDPRGPGYTDNKTPNISRIQAIPADGSSYNPKSGQPANFSKEIKPGDLFNYIAPQLRPLGNAKDLVKVDPNTNELKEGKKTGERAGERTKLSGTRYTVRQRDFFALQEAFGELHITDLSDNYDFISSRWGIQPFVSDFRGFIFADTNLGARIFGSWDNNRLQYNLAYFNQREKDTYSDLNTFDSRHQQVLIANVFRQDAIWKGYTAQLSFHANFDDGGTHYDKNGFLVRPAPLGTVIDDGDFRGDSGSLRGHEVDAFYFGWAGDGHIGKLNITHAFYQVFGQDDFNQLAGRRVDINAQMAALELSVDRDWIRYKISGFYASGDSDPTDRTARGFDSIQDNPFFIGGPFSWYVHEGPNLATTGVGLKQPNSLVPDLRTSKSEGQSNFVNPGVAILGAGTDMDVTPKLKAFLNVNYIWLAETKPIEVALQTNKARHDLGLDTSFGIKYRPLLTDNIIFSAGIGLFFPGGGYRDIYRTNTNGVANYGVQDRDGKVDSCLYNAFFTLTLIY
ncbi:MAG: hypothetical protein JWL59_762 [Chthoniobacteraceae bacterium]|nr:hypothetical protein [Chthoniobacteraceae bacterium]